MNIAFAYNVKKSKPSLKLEEQKDLEFDSPAVINAITKTLEELGHKVFPVEADENAFLRLQKLQGKVDIVFNIAEGLWGDARESQIPLFCEMLKIPYTHSDPTTHAIALDKDFTKLVLKGANTFNMPDAFVVQNKNYKIPDNLKYPLIVKPNKEGSSKGVMDANVVENEKDLRKRIEIVSENFTKELIIEEYIDGREFTVSLLGNQDPRMLPIVEQKFDLLPKGKYKIASFELKWIYEYKMKSVSDVYECPAKLDKKIEKEIEETSKEIYRLLDVRGCARIDYRLNEEGKLYFLEINTLPGINPDPGETSCLPMAVRASGMTYKALIAEILRLGCEWWGIKKS